MVGARQNESQYFGNTPEEKRTVSLTNLADSSTFSSWWMGVGEGGPSLRPSYVIVTGLLAHRVTHIIIQGQVIEINFVIHAILCTDLPTDTSVRQDIKKCFVVIIEKITHDFLLPFSDPSSSNRLISVSLSIASSLCLRRFNFQPSRF